MTRVAAICIALWMNICVSAQTRLHNEAWVLHDLQRNLNQILVNDNISPPVASRIYAYPHLAAELIWARNEGKKAIVEHISHAPKITLSIQHYDAAAAAAKAFYTVASELIYTRKPFADSFAVLHLQFAKQLRPEIMRASDRAGEMVAKQIIAWMRTDGWFDIQKKNKYILSNEPGKWAPTAPGYFGALEPHWGTMRPLLCALPESTMKSFVPVAYDTSRTGTFYHAADQVYTTSLSLTDEQKKIADFWDCNPFALKFIGHYNVAVKKLSPGGHWMNITAIAALNQKKNSYETAHAFTLCAVTLYDAFIHTWDIKYRYAVLRPESFIQKHINPAWLPYLQSPPFPEYISGHAVVSSAAATVLTELFGDHFNFTDNSERNYGIADRSFTSFAAAAREAAQSRVYGGIHYNFSCEAGLLLGVEIANRIRTAVKGN